MNRSFFADLQALIPEGVHAGELRPVDQGIAAHTIVGSTRSLAWWFDPSGPRSAEFVAQEVAELAVRGLLLNPLRDLPPAVADAVTSLRAGLDSLDRALRGETAGAAASRADRVCASGSGLASGCPPVEEATRRGTTDGRPRFRLALRCQCRDLGDLVRRQVPSSGGGVLRGLNPASGP